MPSITKDLNPKSVLHRKLLRALEARINASKKNAARSKFVEKWREAEEKAIAYVPERVVDSIRKAERKGGKPQYTTIQIPYSYAVMLASHTYWTTVFLGRSPVYQMQGLHGEGENQVLAIEAYMAYQHSAGDHTVPQHIWLYDAGKYGVGVIGLYWDEEISTVSRIEERENTFLGVEFGKKKKVKVTEQVKGYEGNRLHNVRPMDFHHDPRVTLANFQQGEFCGHHITMGWNKLIAGKELGYYINLDFAASIKKKSTDQKDRDGVLDIPNSGDFGTAYVDGELAADSFPGYEIYIDLVPKDWGLGEGTMPEKWVFLCDDLFQVILSARPMGAYHNKFPYATLEVEPEGYSIYNRGIPEITEPIQNTVDWLINSHFYNVRKTLNNEYVVDPSRVELRDALNPMPGGMIRLKPAAYGSDTRTAMTQLATSDVTRGHLNDLDMMLSLGERVTGVNEQVMGVASPSSRRSATEVRASNTFSVNRLKTSSEYFSAMGFSPLVRMLVQNSQQYYSQEKKFLLAGTNAALAGQKFIDVTPDAIAGFYDMVPVDGTLPVDRFAQANLWRSLFGEMRQMPAIMQQYDVAKIFGYVAQLAGLKNIDQFKIQVVPDGLLQANQQAGNVVSLGGSGPAKLPSPGEGIGDIL